MKSNSISFPQVLLSLLPKKDKDVNMVWVLLPRPFIYAVQPSLASYTTDECFNYDQRFYAIFIYSSGQNQTQNTKKQSSQSLKNMDTGCVHTVEDLFTKMRKDSSLQDEMTLLHQTIRIFKHPLKHATWIHGIRMNVQKKFKIKIVQILFSLKLHSFESSELKQRERG